ncbi:MAG: hypothetical protein ILP02_02560 [Clostridia bacterium]|nr:hypothetical protein [Clostridia bacterium]
MKNLLSFCEADGEFLFVTESGMSLVDVAYLHKVPITRLIKDNGLKAEPPAGTALIVRREKGDAPPPLPENAEKTQTPFVIV